MDNTSIPNRGNNMGTWSASGEVLRRAGCDSLSARFRRWRIRVSLPVHDSDLSPDEWTALEKRWIDAGGDPEQFENIIEREVLDD